MLYSGPPRSTTSISSLDKRVMRKRAPRRYSAGVLLERASTRSFSKAITLLRRQPRVVSVSALYFALCPFWAPKGPGACGPGPSFFLGALADGSTRALRKDLGLMYPLRCCPTRFYLWC